MAALPDEAARSVARIEAMLDEANRLLERSSAADETTFALRETERRYLPDTLDAYLDIPPSRRDGAADASLLDQLATIERATAERLSTIASVQQTALAANGAFLAERFGDAAPLPALAPTGTPVPLGAPRALVARLFADLEPVGSDPGHLLQRAGERFAAVFPALTSVRRGPFGGPVKSISVDVPLGADMLRYALERERGGIAASCTKIVRGVALRTERVDAGVWLGALLEDMTAYVERDRSTRDLLTTFLAGR